MSKSIEIEYEGEKYTYDNPAYVKFVKDMQKAGFVVEHYCGRWFYRGPAVRTDVENGIDEQDVIRATRVKIQRDTMGRYDTIIYPR